MIAKLPYVPTGIKKGDSVGDTNANGVGDG